MSKLKILFCVFSLLFVGNLFSQSVNKSQVITYTESQEKLRIKAQDVKLIPEEDKELGGYHLYIKKLPNVESVLLTETTKDPEGKNDSYTYRAKEYNKINGDEIRLLDGKQLVSEGAKYSLVDSTVENTDFFGKAFHIYIPQTIVYGYDWTRNGEIEIAKGTFINIRSFDKPYADYTGNYVDNPFMFDLVKKVRPKPVSKIEEETVITDDYNPVASEKFKEISNDLIYSKGPETIVNDILKVLKDENLKENIDLVFAIDATGSMKNDIEKLKKDLLPALKEYFGKTSNTRIGLLFYRDYGDDFRYNNLPIKIFGFTEDFDSFAKNLKSIKIRGSEGGDIPEAVYEAMYGATEFFNWRENVEKTIILIGDAEPHPFPRGSGKYSRDYVMNNAKNRGVNIHSILLPKD